MDDLPWTLEELVAEVAAVLPRLMLSHDNGQVADLPNGRVVRYYQSLGLMGRPQQRGRVAFYGYRHLVEVAAIKRLQSAGLSLMQVDAALRNRTADEVAKVAQLPEERATAAVARAAAPSFWSQPVLPSSQPPLPSTPTTTVTVSTAVHHSSGLVVVLPAGMQGPTPTPSADLMQALMTTLAAHGWAVPAPKPDPKPAPETRGEP